MKISEFVPQYERKMADRILKVMFHKENGDTLVYTAFFSEDGRCSKISPPTYIHEDFRGQYFYKYREKIYLSSLTKIAV